MKLLSLMYLNQNQIIFSLLKKIKTYYKPLLKIYNVIIPKDVFQIVKEIHANKPKKKMKKMLQNYNMNHKYNNKKMI